MEEIKLNITTDNNEVVVRTGEALKPLAPIKYSVTGTVESLKDYINKRKDLMDPNKVVIHMNESEASITLHANPNDQLADQITGQLVAYDHLHKFGINRDKKFGREDLVKLLRFNKIFLDDQEFTSLIIQLKNFTAKVNAHFNQGSDNRANKSHNFTKEVETELAMGFKLTIPIYKGIGPSSFYVDIAFDITDGGVTFWLESVELEELKLRIVQDILNKFKDEFGQDYVIIYQ